MKQSLILIPEQYLEEIKSIQLKILSLFKGDEKEEITDYITEAKAKEILRKKSTWFWQMRRQKNLPFTKIGKTIYYSKADIQKIFEQNKSL